MYLSCMGNRLINTEKVHMSQIPDLLHSNQVPDFLKHLRRVCILRYVFMGDWMDWIGSLTLRPTADTITHPTHRGGSTLEEMGMDVWAILSLKITGPSEV